MKLYEHQAKEVFKESNIPIPQGKVVANAEQAVKAAFEIGYPVVMKSQILYGGRGKAGLIRFASSNDEVAKEAKGLLGREHRGAKVEKLLIEPKLDIGKELYLSILVDPVAAAPLVMASTEGGMEIEELAGDYPGKVIKEYVPVFRGMYGYQGREIARKMGLKGPEIRAFADIARNLYQAFRRFDAELAEINPLVVLKDGSMLAADAKMNIDDNGLFRQKGFEKGRDQYDNDIEYEAAKLGFPYVQIDENGDIGVMSAGAGLTMTTLDLLNYYGGKPANFLEFGGALYQRAVNAMKVALMNKKIKVLCITVFGLIARADVIAEGVVAAIKEHKPSLPIIVAIRGTGEERAQELLKEAGLEPLSDTEEAIKRAVKIAEESE
jgi:succinyl-CoA synthetase beta subunit